jgi:hypothetical protein
VLTPNRTALGVVGVDREYELSFCLRLDFQLTYLNNSTKCSLREISRHII